MRIHYTTILLLIFFSITTVRSQNKIKDYEGHWEGNFNKKNALNFSVSIKDLEDNTYNFSLFNNQFRFHKKVTSTKEKFIEFNIDKEITFTGVLNQKKTEINGFINSGFYFYHIKLIKNTQGMYVGTWNIFMLNELLSKSIFLSIENVQGKKFDAFPFFGDNRFAGTNCMNSKKKGSIITFQDVRTGLQFEGKLLKNTIELNLLLANTVITTVKLKKSTTDWVFGKYSKGLQKQISKLNDGWKIASLKNQLSLLKMERSILSKKLINIHSVLIAKKGKIIYEKYFEGYNATIPHDQRSASKSISSAMIGIAIDDKLIKNENETLYQFIPKNYQYTKDSIKSTISLKNLLTMSSGLDAIDFGIKRKSKASEPAYQNSRDWLKTVLEAPMINTPGSTAYYGSANPYLLGTSLNGIIPIPLQLYIDQKLFKPLDIHNYSIQKEITGIPYFGGGMYLTPRDMLKFGELYLCKGKWNNKRVISKEWVEKSFKNHRSLKNTKEKNGYGYLWWHKTYTINRKKIKSVEARGNGGQYIFVIPKLKVVCVITAGNYNNSKTKLPEDILEKHILPQIINQ